MDREDIERFNERIRNPVSNLDSLKGFEIIAESFVYKVYDLFGRNTLLSILYQVGAGPGLSIANSLKEKYNKEEFEIFEALELLIKELPRFYSVRLRDIKEDNEKISLIIENRCFLREPIKNREKLKPGKALCRINKGYFEVALKSLLGKKIKNVEINFLEDDVDNDLCVEELNFYK